MLRKWIWVWRSVSGRRQSTPLPATVGPPASREAPELSFLCLHGDRALQLLAPPPVCVCLCCGRPQTVGSLQCCVVRSQRAAPGQHEPLVPSQDIPHRSPCLQIVKPEWMPYRYALRIWPKRVFLHRVRDKVLTESTNMNLPALSTHRGVLLSEDPWQECRTLPSLLPPLLV